MRELYNVSVNILPHRKVFTIQKAPSDREDSSIRRHRLTSLIGTRRAKCIRFGMRFERPIERIFQTCLAELTTQHGSIREPLVQSGQREGIRHVSQLFVEPLAILITYRLVPSYSLAKGPNLRREERATILFRASSTPASSVFIFADRSSTTLSRRLMEEVTQGRPRHGHSAQDMIEKSAMKTQARLRCSQRSQRVAAGKGFCKIRWHRARPDMTTVRVNHRRNGPP